MKIRKWDFVVLIASWCLFFAVDAYPFQRPDSAVRVFESEPYRVALRLNGSVINASVLGPIEPDETALLTLYCILQTSTREHPKGERIATRTQSIVCQLRQVNDLGCDEIRNLPGGLERVLWVQMRIIRTVRDVPILREAK